MNIREIIERIMTEHWDMKACECWICREGRKNGCGSQEKYLRHKSKIKVERVTVG